MEWLDVLRPHLLALPNLAKFAIIIAIIVGVPALARYLRIPELIALLVFGVLLGPHVLGVYGTNHPIVQFFADLGKLMLMFTAGVPVENQIRTYSWCNPPRIGRQRIRPALFTVRDRGASLSKAKCVRVSL